MKGKTRCKILKDIRRRIAEENGIEYITSECKYKGDCLGTCPKCEAEVRYLEEELERKRKLGYKVTVAGLAATITLSSAGCTPDDFSEFGIGNKSEDTLMGAPTSAYAESETMGEESEIIEDGEIIIEESETMGEPDDFEISDQEETEVEIIGELPYEETEDELMGDMSE